MQKFVPIRRQIPGPYGYQTLRDTSLDYSMRDVYVPEAPIRDNFVDEDWDWDVAFRRYIEQLRIQRWLETHARIFDQLIRQLKQGHPYVFQHRYSPNYIERISDDLPWVRWPTGGAIVAKIPVWRNIKRHNMNTHRWALVSPLPLSAENIALPPEHHTAIGHPKLPAKMPAKVLPRHSESTPVPDTIDYHYTISGLSEKEMEKIHKLKEHAKRLMHKPSTTSHPLFTERVRGHPMGADTLRRRPTLDEPLLRVVATTHAPVKKTKESSTTVETSSSSAPTTLSKKGPGLELDSGPLDGTEPEELPS